ncbi:cms1 ribosomal small subunit [Branchiostoma belcheri]|nr:cms1 ribosomal small subunit [Branchiostoma belcheri]
MADDLQDEWWLQDDEDDSATKKVEPPQANTDNRKPAKTKLKKTPRSKSKTITRSRPVQDTGKRKLDDVPDSAVSKKNKRRRNKKKISEQLPSEPSLPDPADVMSILLRGQKLELTAVEMEELTLEDKHFLSPNDFSHPDISSYLRGDWPSLVDPHEAKGAPLVIVLTGAAKRAVDLNRDSATFRGKARSIKLFAKHIKVQDQVEQLSKQVVHLAVGTPARVATLVEDDALRLDHVRCVVLDWTYRDVKLRRLCDIPEVRGDLFQLFRKHLIPLAKDGLLKFGLF